MLAASRGAAVKVRPSCKQASIGAAVRSCRAASIGVPSCRAASIGATAESPRRHRRTASSAKIDLGATAESPQLTISKDIEDPSHKVCDCHSCTAGGSDRRVKPQRLAIAPPAPQAAPVAEVYFIYIYIYKASSIITAPSCTGLRVRCCFREFHRGWSRSNLSRAEVTAVTARAISSEACVAASAAAVISTDWVSSSGVN